MRKKIDEWIYHSCCIASLCRFMLYIIPLEDQAFECAPLLKSPARIDMYNYSILHTGGQNLVTYILVFLKLKYVLGK